MSFRVQTWKLKEFIADKRPLEHIEIRTLALETLARREASRMDAANPDRPVWNYASNEKSYVLLTASGLVGSVYFVEPHHEWRWTVSTQAGGRIASGYASTSSEGKAHAQHWLGISRIPTTS